MTAGEHDFDFVIEQGATWNPILTYFDPVGNPVDLTGAYALLEIRFPTTTIILSTDNGGIVLGGASGTIQPIIASSMLSDIANTRGSYVLELTQGSQVSRLIKGKMIISKRF